MRFSIAQYDLAIEALSRAKGQLDPDGDPCRICGDADHQAYECAHNPLHAMGVCEEMVTAARQLHDLLHAIESKMDAEDQTSALCDWREDAHALLHYLAGYDQELGHLVGPAAVVLPPETVA